MKKHMMRKASMDIINWLNCIWLTDLPPNSKYLACYLRKFMNSNHDMAWPSYARIIEETGLSRATVAKYLKILEQEGWINRDSGNSTTNTVYFATLPDFINEEVKNFDNNLQQKLKGSSPAKLRSTPAKQGVVRELNTNKQSNTQSNKQNTDIFSGKQKETYFIDQLCSEEFKHCHEMMRVIAWRNKHGYGGFYTGCLALDEWLECESNMSMVDDFNYTEYASWWDYKYRDSMKKTPSLPNMICDMNGITFDQFYDSVFLQEADI